MYIQEVENVFNLKWNNEGITYKDIHLQNEIEQSEYNFNIVDISALILQFNDAERTANRLIEESLIMPAYEQCIKASHLFNLLDARGSIAVSERTSYIRRVRSIAKLCCNLWLQKKREEN